MVASSFGRTLGRVHGHTAMQIPHEADSAKYGMHLSKSTYQRSSPRTICLSSVIAPGGHAVVQTWQVAQNSSAPKRSGAVATSGMSVVTVALQVIWRKYLHAIWRIFGACKRWA